MCPSPRKKRPDPGNFKNIVVAQGPFAVLPFLWDPILERIVLYCFISFLKELAKIRHATQRSSCNLAKPTNAARQLFRLLFLFETTLCCVGVVNWNSEEGNYPLRCPIAFTKLHRRTECRSSNG